MAIPLTVNNSTFQYPEDTNELWGVAATNWAIAVTTVVDGIFASEVGTKATEGKIRLVNDEAIAWRSNLAAKNWRMALDASDDLILSDGTTDINLSAASSGNVTGPGSSTDNALARYDATTGQFIQNSGVILDDTNNLSGIADIDAATASFSGAVDVASLTATGNIGASGNVSGVDVVASGNVSGVNGTLTGNLGVVDVNASGNLDAPTATLDNTLVIGDGTGTGSGPHLTINNDTGDSALRLQVDNNSATAWDIFNDNSDSDRLKISKAGSVAAQIVPGAAPITLDANNVSSATTPRADTAYANTLVKAWAKVNSSGTLQDGVNLTVSKTGTGLYTYSFRTNMGNANYAIIVTTSVTNSNASAAVQSTSGFRVATSITTSGTLNDAEHYVIVVGEQ